MTKLITLTADNWEQEVLESTQLILVDFQAPWCTSEFVEELSVRKFFEKWGGMVRVGKIDISKFADIASSNEIIQHPTLALFDRGRIIRFYVGPSRVEEMMRKIFTLTGLTEIGVLKD